MTASAWEQVQINLWKWWLVRKRQPLLFLAEILWPCLLLVSEFLAASWLILQFVCFEFELSEPGASVEKLSESKQKSKALSAPAPKCCKSKRI